MTENTKVKREETPATQDQIECAREAYSRLEKELLAILSHPLCPQDFKEVFEK